MKPRHSGTGLGQATIVVADRYPLTHPSDTGALMIAGKEIGTMVITSLGIGAVSGYLVSGKKNPILSAIVGSVIGYAVGKAFESDIARDVESKL